VSDELRIWLVGLGTVGTWLIRALHERSEQLASAYLVPKLVGVANRRDGFVYDARGFDLPSILELLSAGRPLTELPGARHWPIALEGLEATDADVLVEATASRREDGEPGAAHMREALRRAIPVVTSNKWPVALRGVELAELAARERTVFRAESTVMSGTPVLRALLDGLAGSSPIRLRGVLNATANAMLTSMEHGRSYAEALAEAQAAGLAERDPSADVDGFDSQAKTMILAALVFGEQLRPIDVPRSGIAELDRDEIEEAVASRARVRLVSTLEFAEEHGGLTGRVAPVSLPETDPLARIDGVSNAVVFESAPVGEVSITGPGAGPALAGQGVLSDLLTVGHQRALGRARSPAPARVPPSV
jgi:homoserine dehydrogenase